MAIAVTVTNRTVVGDQRKVSGTFTTASGDSTLTITTGLDWIADYGITIADGGVGAQQPKTSISAGVITMVFDDTQGYSGRFWAVGK